MANFFDLPYEIQAKIFARLSTSEHFNIITGKIDPNEACKYLNVNINDGLIERFITLAQYHFFNRDKKEDLEQQRKILQSWLKHWSAYKNLSLFQSIQDKKQWVKLLDSTLSNPLSTLDHKILCCLFINKLFPNENDMASYIVENFSADLLSDATVATQLEFFGRELSQTDMYLKLVSLNFSTYDKVYLIADAIKAMGPYFSSDQKNKLLLTLSSKFYSDQEAYHVLKILRELIPHLAFDQINVLFCMAMSELNNSNAYFSFYGIVLLQELVPHLSGQLQINTLFDSLSLKLSDADQDTRSVAIAALKALIPSLAKETQINTLFECLISSLNDQNVRVRIKAVESLASLASYLTRESQINLLLDKLIDMLNDESSLVRKPAINALIKLPPFLTKSSHVTKLCETFIDRLTDDLSEVYTTALEGLRSIPCILTEEQKNDWLARFIPGLLSRNPYTYQKSDLALNACVPYFSLEQRNTLIQYIFTNLHEKGLYIFRNDKTLKALVPYISFEQRNLLIDYLLSHLKTEARAGLSNMEIVYKDDVIHALAPYFSIDDMCEIMTTLATQFCYASKQRSGLLRKIILKLLHLLSTEQRISLFDDLVITLDGESHNTSNAAEIISKLLPYLTQERKDIVFDVFHEKLNDNCSEVCIAAIEIMAKLWPELNEIESQNELINHFLMALDNQKNNICFAALQALKSLAPHAMTDLQKITLLNALIYILQDSDSVVRHRAINALSSLAAYLPKESDRIIMFHALVPRLNIEKYDARAAVVNALNIIASYITNIPSDSLRLFSNESKYERIFLEFIFETRSHVHQKNNLTIPELTRKGVYFSHKNNATISQDMFNSSTNSWDNPRSFRLWSKSGDKPCATDDCMTEIDKNKPCFY